MAILSHSGTKKSLDVVKKMVAWVGVAVATLSLLASSTVCTTPTDWLIVLVGKLPLPNSSICKAAHRL